MGTNSTTTQYCINYRFKQNKNIFKKVAYHSTGYVLFYLFLVLVYMLFFSNKPEAILDYLLENRLILFILLIYLFSPAITLLFVGRNQININQYSITFKGLFFPRVPKNIAWSEIASIYKTDHPHQSMVKKWTRVIQPLTLIFVLKSGDEFTLIINNNKDDIFIGDEHPLDIVRVLELYGHTIYSIESLSEEERKKILICWIRWDK